MVLANNFEAAATEMRSLLRSSNSLHCLPRSLSQNWQSAAPPAIVPSKNGLISITFFTLCEAVYHRRGFTKDTDEKVKQLASLLRLESYQYKVPAWLCYPLIQLHHPENEIPKLLCLS